MNCSPQAAAYPAFLAEHFPPPPSLLAELLPLPDPEPDELAWQSRWFSGDFGRDFLTTSGSSVSIIDFGWWNHGAGPDFRDCVISIAGELRRGSIELDGEARDWDHHGHSTNPAYRDTVLHLQLSSHTKGEWFTRTDDHRLVPQVRLDLATPLGDFNTPAPPAAHPGRCLNIFRQLGPDKTLSILEAAARYRLERKSARLQRTAAIHGRDQALFQAFADALGYSRNRLPLTVLAQRLPLKFLLSRPDDSEALLFGVSGFLHGQAFDHADTPTRAWLRGLWDQWWRYRDTFAPGQPRLPLRWNLTGTRPLNHPQRRIATLQLLVKNWPSLRRLLQPATFREKALRTLAASLHHPYWDHHYTLQALPSAKPMALLGSNRLTEILANVCYPLLIAEHEPLWAAYQKIPAPTDNEKSRRAALRLFSGHPHLDQLTGKLWQQQALLQIYEDFCLTDHTNCAACPMPEQAARQS
ncbi:MAG: hypothetical protein JWL81_1011 [Verrucomicrobiales bacterium]|nr:hypothetical protein [Verrucomicrobiales bacterium]